MDAHEVYADKSSVHDRSDIGVHSPPLYTLVLDFEPREHQRNHSASALLSPTNTSGFRLPFLSNHNVTIPSHLVQTSSPVDGIVVEETGELVPCGLFFFMVYGPLFCFVCLVGLVGNALSFLVLHKYSRDSVATFLLKALAVSDNLFLATASFVQVYPAMSMYFGLVDQLTPVYPYLQTYAWSVAHMVQMGSVYMMVLVAANRYIAVCRPLQAPRLCTKGHVYLQIIFMTVAILIYNIPRFFEYRYVKVNVTDPATNQTVAMPQNVGLVGYTVYNILYENISYLIFVFLIPLLVLTVFNVHLVLELRRASENRKLLASGRTREENNITLVMIVIIVIFIACQTPASVNQVLYYTIGQSNPESCTRYEQFYHLSNLFITMNSATNFFVYCLFRRQFRHELCALLCCFRGHLGMGAHGDRSGAGRTPIRRTLLLRALHQQNSFSSSFSNTMTTSSMHHKVNGVKERSTQVMPDRDSHSMSPQRCPTPNNSIKGVPSNKRSHVAYDNNHHNNCNGINSYNNNF